MALSEWHGARLKPAVKHLRDTLQHTLTLLGWDLDVIDVFAVDVVKGSASGETLQLFDASYTDNFLSIITNPDRNRIAPEAVS